MLASKSWARLSISLLWLLPALASPQAFGRFGYGLFPDVPGFQLNASGFRANFPAADRFAFPTPGDYKAALVSERSVTYVGAPSAEHPQKLRANLNGPGFEMYFSGGVEFRVTSLQGPLLTVGPATYGPDTPTPRSKHVLVSFRDAQPPVMLVFFADAPDLVVNGKPGEWRIRTRTPYKGWMRACLPLGLEAVATNSAAILGRLANELERHEAFWSKPAPNVVSVSIQEGQRAITATWKFDSPSALVPPAALLAGLGGYPAQVLSPLARTGSDVGFGPVTYTTSNELRVQFPIRRVPAGRAICLGSPPEVAPSSDPVVLAFENLLAAVGPSQEPRATRALDDFLAQTKYSPEPWTGQSLPYPADGAGMDRVAEFAVLMQSLLLASGGAPENALLTSLAWRRDWVTWLVASPSPELASRTGALAAIAGGLSPTSELRLEGALFQAGLAAQRGLARLRREAPPPEQPYESLRRALFGGASDELFEALASPLRSAARGPVLAETKDGGLVLTWTPQDRPLELFAPFDLKAAPGNNVKSIRTVHAFGATAFFAEFEAPGPAQIDLAWPKSAPTIPKLALPTAAKPPDPR